MSNVVTSEQLTTGWEPEVRVDDTLLRQFVFNSADRNEHHAAAMNGTWRQWDDVCLADLREPSGFGNQAILLQPLTEESTAGVIERLRDGFSGIHCIFSAWPTPDLRPYGLALIGHPPFMVRPQGGAAPVRPPELVIEEVTDAASMEKYERVFIEGYPVPELQPYEPGRLFDERLLGGIARAWVGSVNGRPVAGSMAINSRGLIAVENVATLPEARGHGYGAALTATAALSEPDLPSALIASDDGRGVYERLGFLPISRFTLWAGLT
jgi:GNAT superfamily N-acetyltransferase